MLNIIFRRCILIVLLFCKQKTAYVMRISDLSSDVCSSDLEVVGVSLEDAEQTVVHAPALHPDLVEARHAAVHRLPLTATGERRRRSLRHGSQSTEQCRIGNGCVSTSRLREEPYNVKIHNRIRHRCKILQL